MVRCITRRASGAAAGLLAPSIGNLSAPVRTFFAASLARYPEFVAELRAFEPELEADRGTARRLDPRRPSEALASAIACRREEVEANDPAVARATRCACFTRATAPSTTDCSFARFGALWRRFPA